MARKLQAENLPHIDELCSLLGLSLLESMESIEGQEGKRRVFFLAEFDYQLSGTPKRIVTPFFESLPSLEDWCKERRNKVSTKPFHKP